MSAWASKSGGPPAWMWALLGVTGLATVVLVAATAKSIVSDTPRPTPGGGTVTPGAPPEPGAIAPGADKLEYSGHDIYLWEQLDDALVFVEWRWVTLDPSGLVFDSGVNKTPGLDGAAAARASAEGNIDRKFVP